MSSLLGLISRRIAPRCRVCGRRNINMCSGGHEELVGLAAPCLMLPPSFPKEGNMVYNLYSPMQGKVVCFNNRGGKEEADLMRDEETYVVGSSRGWLALLNTRSRHMSLCNPLSGRLVHLPPLAGKPFSPDDELQWPPKVIISSSPAPRKEEEEEDCRALMFLGVDSRAAVCRPGRSSKWVPLDEWPIMPGGHRYYLDFVYSSARRRFFGLLETGHCFKEELEGWEVDASLCQRMDRLNRFSSHCFESNRSPHSPIHYATRYLVYEEESGQLFLVRRYQIVRNTIDFMRDLQVMDREKVDIIDREKVDFDVYRIDDGGGLELCSSLDGLAMFVGINESFAVKASRFQLEPNSIYFSDARHPYVDEPMPKCQCIETFDYQHKTCAPLYFPSRNLNHTTPLPWFFPSLD